MENSVIISPQILIDNITLYLTGTERVNHSFIKVNSEKLSTTGELCFLPSLKIWSSLLEGKLNCNEHCRNILCHLLHRSNVTTEGKTDEEVTKKAFELITTESKKWVVHIEKCSLYKERVCLYLSRTQLIADMIRLTILQSNHFGRYPASGKIFCVKFCPDEKSGLTTTRLQLITKVTERIMDLQGHEIRSESSRTHVFVTKSENQVEDKCKTYLCGVVKNLQTNAKETKLTWEEYVGCKFTELVQLNERKLLQTHEPCTDSFLQNLAAAIVTFELLSIKPGRPVFVGKNVNIDRSTTNTKGVSFVLYNTARIATILSKYNKKQVSGEYPPLPNIENVDFSQLDQEEEWELVYNFIFGYPQMIRDCLRHEGIFQTCPQLICLFLLRLCQKFSAYYRRVRILTEGRKHLIPKIIVRLYLLKALQIILQNALTILNINSVSHM